MTGVTLAFRGQASVTVHAGEQIDVSLRVRRPESRQLRFIDESGRPVTDITMYGWMFWSRSNHCGVLSGAERLFSNMRPNPDGLVTVPDGDVEYAFEIHGQHLSVVDPATEGAYPTSFTMYFDSPERLVRVRRHSRVALEVLVTVGGRPAPYVQVGASAPSGCGNGTYTLGMTDGAGLLRIPEFYPDEVDAVCVSGVDGQPLSAVSVGQQRRISFNLPSAEIGEPRFCYLR